MNERSVIYKKIFTLILSFLLLIQFSSSAFTTFSVRANQSWDDSCWFLSSPHIGLYDHCIITKRDFIPLFSEYKAFMSDRGIDTCIFPYETILSTYEGKNDAEKIRKGINDIRFVCGIKSVWLVGDYDMIPIPKLYIYPKGMNTEGKGPICTDFLYSSLLNEWYADERGFHGYFEKYFLNFASEIQVGRLPFDNPNKIEIYLKNLLSFYAEPELEKNRCLSAGAWLSFKEESIFTLDKQNFDVDGANIVYTNYRNYFSSFEHIGLYEIEGLKTSSLANIRYPLNYDNFIQVYNELDPTIVLLCGHGRGTGICRQVWEDDINVNKIAEYKEIDYPEFIDCSSLSRLTPTNHSIVFCDSCITCSDDHYTLGPKMVEDISVGFVGSNSYSKFFFIHDDKPNNFELNTSCYGLTALIQFYFSKNNTMGDSIRKAIDLYWEICQKSPIQDFIPYYMENIYSITLLGDPLLVLNNRPIVDETRYIQEDTMEKGDSLYNLKDISIAKDDMYYHCKFAFFEDIDSSDFNATLLLKMNPDQPGNNDQFDCDGIIKVGYNKETDFIHSFLLWNPYIGQWDTKSSISYFNRYVIHQKDRYIRFSIPKALVENRSFKYRFIISNSQNTSISSYPSNNGIYSTYPKDNSKPEPVPKPDPDPEEPNPKDPEDPKPEPGPNPEDPDDPNPKDPPKQPEPPPEEPKPEPPKEPDKERIVREISIFLRIGDFYAKVNDTYMKLDIAPLEKNDRVFVPLRFIAESFGAIVEWQEDDSKNGEGTIRIEYTNVDSSKILIQMHTLIDTAFITFIHNGTVETKEIKLEVAPFIVKPENRTVVPIRFIAESFGATIDWDETNETIHILLQERET